MIYSLYKSCLISYLNSLGINIFFTLYFNSILYYCIIRNFLLYLLWLTSYKCIMEMDEIVAKAKKELSEEKDGAVWLAMMELSDYIKFSAIAKNYFNKSSNWILQRLHGYEVNGKPARFKPEEMTVFVRALREISAKLNKCADRLEQAK